MSIFENKACSMWQDWADEYLFYLRALDPEYNVIEAVREKPLYDDKASYRHEIVFLGEYLSAPAQDTLANILSAYDYNSLYDFAMSEGAKAEYESINDLTHTMRIHLAALIVEYHADRYDPGMNISSEVVMSCEDAIKQVKEIVGTNEAVSKVRHALCRDCDHCEDGVACGARGCTIDPDMPAFEADCGRFLFEGMGECYCVRSKSDETLYNEPMAYIVTEEDISCSEMSAELRKQNLLRLRESSFPLLTFYPWDFRTKDFANTPRDEDAADKIYATCLLLHKVDEALQHYGTDILSVDLNDETGMYDINLCFGSSSDCYAAGVASEDAVLKAALINGLDAKHVGYVF